jgi:hypothetical protein
MNSFLSLRQSYCITFSICSFALSFLSSCDKYPSHCLSLLALLLFYFFLILSHLFLLLHIFMVFSTLFLSPFLILFFSFPLFYLSSFFSLYQITLSVLFLFNLLSDPLSLFLFISLLHFMSPFSLLAAIYFLFLSSPPVTFSSFLLFLLHSLLSLPLFPCEL